ncbi:DUF6157 family protein [Nonomuraea angiospora]|uniref:DUF6157 family protein n=1 Tax=Nonomuraea angiospora TaxID=46172 RepID=UPI0033234F0A
MNAGALAHILVDLVVVTHVEHALVVRFDRRVHGRQGNARTRLQYELLRERPFELTQEDALFLSWLMRRPGFEDRTDDEVSVLRDAFFAKDQPCLRASPLPKKYGFGLLADAEGRLTLCPMESEEYKAGLEDGEVTVLKALRSSRR